MRSRFLVGASAWLLGALTATTGSMIIVDQLAHGLLNPQTQLLGGASSADLDSGSVSPTPATASGSTSPSTPAVPIQPSASPIPAGGAAPQVAAPTLLTSADGSVLAECQSGGAYLVYWSPDQGYSAGDVARGPAPTASVTFSNRSGGVIMRVSCPSGTPVAHVSSISPSSSGSPTDD